MGVSGGKLAPDSIAVDGINPEIEFEREAKSKRLYYKRSTFEPITSNGPSVTIEWNEGPEVFEAKLLLRQMQESAIYINTQRWKDAHKDLPTAERMTYLVLVGDIKIDALKRNGIEVSEDDAARVLEGS